MSLEATDTGPGQETAPAFAFPSLDFDGGLINRWQFTQSPADALAWLRLKSEWSGRARITFVVASLGVGAVAASQTIGFLPFGVVEAIVIAATFLARDLRHRYHARLLVPASHGAVLEEWADSIAGTELGTTEDVYLSHELIGRILLTKTHLVIESHATTIVVPRTAFADAIEAEAIAAHFTQLSRGPYYFEA